MSKVATLGSLIDEMSEIREKRRVIASEDKVCKDRYDELEAELISALDKQGMAKGTGRKASASISTTVVAAKTDWDMFMTWLVKTKNTQLVQQRVSDPAYRELRERLGKAIPGLEDFEKRSVNLRNL